MSVREIAVLVNVEKPTPLHQNGELLVVRLIVVSVWAQSIITINNSRNATFYTRLCTRTRMCECKVKGKYLSENLASRKFKKEGRL